jgi:hypothetical protein
VQVGQCAALPHSKALRLLLVHLLQSAMPPPAPMLLPSLLLLQFDQIFYSLVETNKLLIRPSTKCQA